MSRRRLIELLVVRWGFAAMVVVAGVSEDEFVIDLLTELADEIDDLEIRVEEKSDVR